MIILVGASATGKTEVGKKLEEKYNIKKVVTYTTRPMREHEVDGIDYNFVSNEEFKRLYEKEYFFETMHYNGNLYGTSYESLKDDFYVILDPTGLKKYLNSNIKTISFYLYCDECERKIRMLGRGDKAEKVEERLKVDSVLFTDELKSLTTYAIDVCDKTLDEVTNLIYELSNQSTD